MKAEFLTPVVTIFDEEGNLDKEGNKFYVHQGLMRKNNIETILNSLGVK